MIFTFYSDPGHAWLKVPRNLLNELNIAHEISCYSFQRNNYVYLEEDCDASLFINAMEKIGKVVEIKESFVYYDSQIRNYPQYKHGENQ